KEAHDPEAEAIAAAEEDSSDEDGDPLEMLRGHIPEEHDPSALYGQEEYDWDHHKEAFDRLLVDHEVVQETPSVEWEDFFSPEVLAVVQLQGNQYQLLDNPFGNLGGNWATALASAADAKITVSMQEASIEAATPTARRKAELLIKKFLEFMESGGILVDPNSKHSFMTLLKWTPRREDRELLKDFTANYQVLAVPARAFVEEPAVVFGEGRIVEVKDDRGNWTPAIVKKEPSEVSRRVWVLPVDSNLQKEVEVENIRIGFDMVAIFGEKQSRACVQLALMSHMWKEKPGFDFGKLSAVELSEDDTWGTLRYYFGKEKTGYNDDWLSAHAPLIEKVVQQASGTAVAILGQLVLSTGFRWERSCAVSMIKDMLVAHEQHGEIPPFKEDRLCSIRLRVARQSIPHVVWRRPGAVLPEEDDFQVLILRSSKGEESRDASSYRAGVRVEVADRGRWHEATVAEKGPEEDATKVKVIWEDSSISEHESHQVRFVPVDDVLIIYAAEAVRRERAALHFLAKTAATASDGGTKALRDMGKLKTVNKESVQTEQVEQEKGSADLLKKVVKRVARASLCGVEAVADCVVLHGEEKARERAKFLLKLALQQQGDPLAELVKPDDISAISVMDVSEQEVKALTAEMVEEVEKEARVYVFIRDDTSQQQYKYNDKIEFLWVQDGQPESSGKWSDGQFVRRCIGEGNAVKVRYEHQQKQFETVVPLRCVRPEQSRRAKPGMCIYSCHPGSLRFGVSLATRLLQARLRDSMGRASTGQAWYRNKGSGGGGKGGGKWQGQGQQKSNWGDQKSNGDWQKNDWRSNNRQDWGQRDDWKQKKDWKQDDWPKKDWNKSQNWSKQDDNSSWKQGDSWGQDNWKQKESTWQSDNKQAWGGQSNSSWSYNDSGHGAQQEQQEELHILGGAPMLSMDEAAREAEEIERQWGKYWSDVDDSQIPSQVAMWEINQTRFFGRASRLPGHWLRMISKKTRKMYYTNVKNMASTFDVRDCFLHARAEEAVA
ncbi:unnamed protein product, partial [Symbiodinium pilosum]